jgi:cell division septation protein DedD
MTMAQVRTGQRVEVKVERHQLFLLFIIGLTVIALTFSLGVMTGKRLTGLAGGDGPKGDIKQVDKAAEAEKALKKGDPAAPPPGSGAPSVLQQLAAAAKEKEAGQARAEKAVKEPPAEKPDKAAKEKTAPEKPAKNGKDKESAGPAVKEPREPKEDAAATGDPEFTLQISALPDRNQAVALAAQMEKKGYRAHISTAQVPDKGTMYRVRIGHFKTKDEANAFRDEFQKKENRNGFVTPSK